MIRISAKEIGSSPAKHLTDFRVVQNDNGEVRRPDALRPRKCRDPKTPARLGGKLPQGFGTDRRYSDVLAVRARYIAGIGSNLGYAEAAETQANSIRVPPGSRTIKCTLGPLPDRSGANSITMSGHAATRACKASSASRSKTLSARWCKPTLRRRSNGTHFSESSTCQSVTMPFPSDTKDAG